MKKENIINRVRLLMNYDTKTTLNENLIKLPNIMEQISLDEIRLSPGEFDSWEKSFYKLFSLGGKELELAVAKGENGLKDEMRDIALKDYKEGQGKLGNSNMIGDGTLVLAKQRTAEEVIRRGQAGETLTSDKIKKIYEDKKNEGRAIQRQIENDIKTKKIADPTVDFQKKATNLQNKNKDLKAQNKDLLQKIEDLQNGKLNAKQVSQTDASNIITNNINIGGTPQDSANSAKTAAENIGKTDATLAEDIKETSTKTQETLGKGNRWQKFKNKFSQFNGYWKLVLGAGATWGVYKLWTLYYPNSDAKEKGVFPDCAADLLDDNGTEVAVTTQGSPVIHAKQTGNAEYDKAGGLYFYTNGRVFSGDMKRKGSYSCQGGEIKTQTNENLINEQSAELTPQQMSQYVDDARSNLRGYVVLSDLKNLLGIMHLLTNKTFQGKSALNAFLEQYKGTYNDDFATTLNSVGVKNMGNAGYQLKSQILQYTKGGIGGDTNPHTGLGKINITWDGAGAATTTGGGSTGGGTATGDNTVKPTQEAIQYHDCSQKNLDNGDTLEIGCTSPLIKNIQDCLLSKNIQLKGGADSKFGPSLSAYLDGKKEIDKAEYDRLMAICADQKKADTTDANGDLSDMDTADSLAARDQANTPAQPELHHSPESSQAPKEAPANVVAPSAPEETGEQLFKKWVGTYFRNKLLGKKQAVGQNRLFFKGPDLTQADFDKLNQYLQQNGYQLSNDEHDKRYGDKYVWRKEGNQGQPAAAEPQQISEEFIKNIVGKHLRSKL
jgi:hypothetical protein